MKLGIIIICHNIENDIDRDFFINHSNKEENLEICLVNNDSSDRTFDLINTIKENCKNVSVVNMKKHKSATSAVRAGARYMFNQFNLKHLGYISNMNNYEMNGLFETISEHHEALLNYNLTVLKSKETRQTMFQSLFSVTEYLKKLELNV